jgi:hypothetical protein
MFPAPVTYGPPRMMVFAHERRQAEIAQAIADNP